MACAWGVAPMNLRQLVLVEMMFVLLALPSCGRKDGGVKPQGASVAAKEEGKGLDAAAYGARGDARLQAGDWDKAIEDYDRAIALKPDFAEAYNKRGSA